MAVAGERGDIGVGTEPSAAKIDQDYDTMSGTREGEDVVEEICGLLESISQLGEYRRCFRRECHGLARRIKLLSPFLEEVKDAQYDDGGVLPDQAVRFLVTLKEAVLFGEKLLKTCHGGSKIFLVVEQEAIMTRFHRAHDLLCKALLGVPYDELGISDEVKEQVELLRVQLARARRGTDTQDMELAMDLMAVFSEDNEHNLDRAIVERLAKKLELSTVEHLKAETIAVKNIVNERGGGEHREPVDQIIDLLNKLKQVLGVEVTDVISDPVGPKTLRKCPSVVIPYEFLCPITLSIMTDPVIIASGQTYERESIQKWFDSNHRTCPQTRQTLAHLSLAPNYALKNLIEQWCEKNNYPLPTKDVPSSSKGAAVEDTEAICSLVKNLSSKSLDVQREAVKKVRVLSRENSDCRSLIADKGGITPLIQLLSYPDSKIQENAVTSLLNLSLNEANKKLIARKEAIPAIIEVLQKGSTEAKENAAAALFSLSMVDENKVMVGSCNGIPPLVHLLEHGTVRGKRDAAYALFNLSLNNANKGAAIDAGIFPPLLELLKDKNLGMVDEALSILLLLAAHPRGRTVIGQLSFIETLVSFIADGTPKNKECAASVLLELGSKNSNLLLAALQFSVYDRLVEISNTGTNRAKRKAAALLGLISKTEQI